MVTTNMTIQPTGRTIEDALRNLPGGRKRIGEIVRGIQNGDPTAVQELYAGLYIDAQTGIGNRRAFDEKIGELDSHSIVISGDVLGLKAANDSPGGTAAGDQLISSTAEGLQGSLRFASNSYEGPDKRTSKQTDYLQWIADDGQAYRVGGDEFAAILPDVLHLAIGGTILERTQNRFNNPNKPLNAIALSGAAYAPGMDPEAVRALSEDGMYAMKYGLYNEDPNKRRDRTDARGILSGFALAHPGGRFQLFFPKGPDGEKRVGSARTLEEGLFHITFPDGRTEEYQRKE